MAIAKKHNAPRQIFPRNGRLSFDSQLYLNLVVFGFQLGLEKSFYGGGFSSPRHEIDAPPAQGFWKVDSRSNVAASQRVWVGEALARTPRVLTRAGAAAASDVFLETGQAVGTIQQPP